MDIETSCMVVAGAGLALLLSVVGVLLGGMALARMGALQKRLIELGIEFEALRRGRGEGRAPEVLRRAAADAPEKPATPPMTAPGKETAKEPSAASPGITIPGFGAGQAQGAPIVTAAETPPVEAAKAPPVGPAKATPVGGMGVGYAARPPALPWTPPSKAQRERGMADLESKIGQRWIAWVGAIVVFLSVVFFLKYAFQNDWIGPTGQVVISALGGAALAAGGSYYLGRKWRIFGQCLMGLGLAILYAAFYGAFQLYVPAVMGQDAAFGFMIGVTVAGMALAVLHDAVSMAFLAVLGGILTPVLVSTPHDSRDTLFAYLLLLDVGVIGVAFYRGWRLLDTLALVGTYILYAGWWHKFYAPAGLWPAVAWLGGFYVVFLVLPFTYHLVRRQVVTVERFVMAVANAAFAASFAWYMLRTDYLFTMGFVALGMAGAYLVLGMLLRKRLPTDEKALFGAITMTVTFLTLAVPMQLHAHGIMLAWVAEAPVLALLAYRFGYEPLRALAFLVLVVAVGRLFGSRVHWPLHQELFVAFANKQFWSALSVPAAGGVYAVVHQLYVGRGTAADRMLKLMAALGSGLLALVIVHAELRGWMMNDYGAYEAACAVTALWALGALAYVGASVYAVRAAPWIWALAALALAVAVILGLGTYDQDTGAGHVLFGNARFAACLLVVAAAAAQAGALWRAGQSREGPERGFAITFLVVGLLGLLALLSTEVYTYCVDVIVDGTGGRAGQMSITLVWSVYAAGLLWAGFWRRWRWVRWGGLGLFGVAALKLLAVDLSFLKDIYRIVAFLVLGVLMLAASYFYHRLEKRLMGAAEPRSDEAQEDARRE